MVKWEGFAHQNVVEEKELPLFDTFSAHFPKETLSDEDTTRYQQHLGAGERGCSVNILSGFYSTEHTLTAPPVNLFCISVIFSMLKSDCARAASA